MRTFFATVIISASLAVGVIYTANLGNFRQTAQNTLRFPDVGEAMLADSPNTRDYRYVKLSHMPLIKHPDVVFMGSSRILNMNHGLISSEQGFFNMAVEGPTYQDHVGLWQALEDAQKRPRYVVLFVDYWLFNKKNDLFPRFSTQVPFKKFIREKESRGKVRLQRVLEPVSNLLEHWQFVCSWDLLLESVKSILHGGPKAVQVVKTENIPADVYGYFLDGSTTLHTRRRDDVEQTVQEFPKTSHLVPWQTDPDALLWLDALIKDMQSKSVKVFLICPPYHPATWRYMTNNADYHYALNAAQEQIRKLAAMNPEMSVCPAMTAEEFGCAETEFADAIHPLPACGKKVVDFCLGRDPDGKKLLP